MTAVGGFAGVCVHAGTGRKVKAKFGDIEVEAGTAEALGDILQSIARHNVVARGE